MRSGGSFAPVRGGGATAVGDCQRAHLLPDLPDRRPLSLDPDIDVPAPGRAMDEVRAPVVPEPPFVAAWTEREPVVADIAHCAAAILDEPTRRRCERAAVQVHAVAARERTDHLIHRHVFTARTASHQRDQRHSRDCFHGPRSYTPVRRCWRTCGHLRFFAMISLRSGAYVIHTPIRARVA